jgi:hypothetical protein
VTAASPEPVIFSPLHPANVAIKDAKPRPNQGLKVDIEHAINKTRKNQTENHKAETAK